MTAHYERLERTEAIANLMTALRRAMSRIERAPAAGLPAPRPYPKLAHAGRLWLKEGRYWFAYIPDPLAIVGIYWEQANIPGRA